LQQCNEVAVEVVELVEARRSHRGRKKLVNGARIIARLRRGMAIGRP
jgi:hypothetical protein